MRGFPLVARLHLGDCRRLRSKYQLINIALWSGEFPAYRKRTRDIGSVAVNFTARVNQHQFSIFEQGIVLHIMKDARICSTGHYRSVCGSLRTLAPEFVE